MPKYKLILADPPWQYENATTGRNNISGAEHHYKTMPIEDICAYTLPELATKSALFLWCTTRCCLTDSR